MTDNHGEEDFLGKTNRFPEGQLNSEDEGEIQIAITTDVGNGKIVLNFGTPVVWLGLDPRHAREIGTLLIQKANEITASTLQ